MKRMTLVGVLAAVAVTAYPFYALNAAGDTNETAAGKSAIRELPAGYRDWTMISVASVGGPIKDLRVKLGNELAIRAYRAGKTPFPDGAIIARLAYRQATSDQNNAAFKSPRQAACRLRRR